MTNEEILNKWFNWCEEEENKFDVPFRFNTDIFLLLKLVELARAEQRERDAKIIELAEWIYGLPKGCSCPVLLGHHEDGCVYYFTYKIAQSIRNQKDE